MLVSRTDTKKEKKLLLRTPVVGACFDESKLFRPWLANGNGGQRQVHAMTLVLKQHTARSIGRNSEGGSGTIVICKAFTVKATYRPVHRP